MDPRYPEWTELDSHAPVRQGDVLISINPSEDPWRAMLVVLTADCDLAKSKHDGALTCVPILTASDYLLKFRYPRLRRGLSVRLAESAIQLHKKVAKEDAAAVSVDRMREWMLEDGHEAIARALELEGAAGLSFERFACSRAGLWPRMQRQSPKLVKGSRLPKSCSMAGPSTKYVPWARVGPMLVGGPTWRRLVSQRALPQHGVGYVAYLRRVVEVNDAQVVQTTFRLSPER